jgi:hypothetical protein
MPRARIYARAGRILLCSVLAVLTRRASGARQFGRTVAVMLFLLARLLCWLGFCRAYGRCRWCGRYPY